MKLRRGILLSLAFLLILSLFAACGKAAEEPPETGSAAPEATTSSSNAPTETAKANSDDEAIANFKPVTWKLSYNAAAGQPMDVALIDFAEKVKERTEGRVTIELYGNNILGPDTSTSEMAVEGTIQMIAIGDGFLNKFNPVLDLAGMSFLFRSREELLDSYLGEWGQKYLYEPFIENQGLLMLDCWPQAERMLISTKPVTCLADLKGVKVRVPSGIPLYDACWTAKGALTTSLALSDAFTGMQQGVVDAVEMPLDFIYNYRFMEVAKYVTETKHIVYGQIIFVNEDAYNLLLPADQEIIQEEVKAAGVYATQLLDENVDNIKQDMINNYGCTFYELTDEQRAEFENVVAPLYDTYMNNWGAECYDELMDSLSKFR